MAEPWLLVASGDLTAGGSVELDPDEARHACQVLRLRPGAAVTLADGRGHVARAVLSELDRRRGRADISELESHARSFGPDVELALAVLHGQAMDWAVQKAVEVGVRRLLPTITDRCQLSASAATRRLPHWERLARQALKQCRRPWSLDLEDAVVLADLVRERGMRGGLVAAIDGRPAATLDDAAPWLLLVGPEGGLSDAERRLLENEQWPLLRLGPHVLRSETAAVVGAATLVARLEARVG